MTECFLSDEEIQDLDRDLRILIATDGTLTRMLNVVANDRIIVEIIEQQIHHVAPKIPELEQLAIGRVLQRRVLLKGRRSGTPLVAAESLIAIDLLPPAIITTLTNTDCPIGEVMAANALETIKKPADVWIGQLPDWVALAGFQNSRRRTVGRRYRIITGGQPVIIISEYFLQNVFQDAPFEKLDRYEHRDDVTNKNGDRFALIDRFPRSP